MYTAQRTALNDYSLYDVEDRPISLISFTAKFAVWAAEHAPLTGAVRDLKREAFPVLTVQGVSHIARKRLLTNHLLFNDFDVWLEREGESTIAARMEAARWINVISYQGVTYHLKRRSLFSFRFDLLRGDGSLVASFTETTPVWRVSVCRNYSLLSSQPMDDTLLTFAFFLATTVFYG